MSVYLSNKTKLVEGLTHLLRSPSFPWFTVHASFKSNGDLPKESNFSLTAYVLKPNLNVCIPSRYKKEPSHTSISDILMANVKPSSVTGLPGSVFCSISLNTGGANFQSLKNNRSGPLITCSIISTFWAKLFKSCAESSCPSKNLGTRPKAKII